MRAEPQKKWILSSRTLAETIGARGAYLARPDTALARSDDSARTPPSI